MPDRKWVPNDYLDEFAPPARPTPSAWIDKAVGDVWLLAPYDDIVAGSDDDRVRVQPGDVAPFAWTESFGRIAITVEPDGSYTTDRLVPAGADHFCLPGDPDTLQFDLDDLAAWLAEELGAAETFEVSAYTWSVEPVPFRFVVDAAGPRFEEVKDGAAYG